MPSTAPCGRMKARPSSAHNSRPTWKDEGDIVFEQLDIAPLPTSLRGQSTSGLAPNVVAGRSGRASSGIIKKDALTRPQQLLELACKAVGAGRGGMALSSANGARAEHVSWGVSEPVAAEFWRSTCVGELIQFIRRQPTPTRLDDLGLEQPSLANPQGFPPIGPFLGVPLSCAGRTRGGLYLVRDPGQLPFTAQDVETVVAICGWLEQGNLWEETRLLAQLQVLNQVAQAVAGNPDLSRILSVALRELNRQLPLHVCAVWLPSPLTSNHWGTTAGVQGAPGRTDCQSGPHADRPGRSEGTDTSATETLPAEVIVANSSAGELGLEPGLRLALAQTPFTAPWQDGQAVYSDLGRPEECSDELSRNLAAGGATSSFVVPLRAADRVVGVLQSVCTRPIGSTREQLQLLHLVADLLGPAISNCQLFTRLRQAYEELSRT